MPTSSARAALRCARPWGVTAVTLLGLAVTSTSHASASMSSAEASGAPAAAARADTREVAYHGYSIRVPSEWAVKDLRNRPHACVRFDRPTVYLGHAGDQSFCPAHLIGGAPGVWLQPLDRRTAAMVRDSAAITARTTEDGKEWPAQGPVSFAVEAAGVVVTAVYGEGDAAAASARVEQARILPSARPMVTPALRQPSVPSTARASRGANVPGNYVGKGFDACTAPSDSLMDAWLASSPYRSVGVYIGGVSRACAQPNLTAAWLSSQVTSGWHVIPTYVGMQAPCTNYYHTMSYDPATARAQGRAEAADAADRAAAVGIAAPSTLYSDIEGYDNTSSRCVAGVLSYLSGWTRGLHERGYQSGVYSSASSGITDLSRTYNSPAYNRPDDIWLAWWNNVADTDGGSYVPDTQWSNHQRIHQYTGSVTERYGGYSLNIDRNALDVSTAVERPEQCPTELNFSAYPVLRVGDTGREVLAAQCQLVRRGFSPGAATGTVGWRTTAAIEAFKASRALPSGPALGRRSWTALLSGGTTPRLEAGSRGPAVARLQRALSASLARTVAVTRSFDSNTERAVRSYQRAHVITVDGIAGAKTWAALQSGQ